MSFLKVDNLSAGYGNLDVIFDITMELDENKIVTLLGPNGAGKSTILKITCGILKPKGGEISFLGKSINELSTREERSGAEEDATSEQ